MCASQDRGLRGRLHAWWGIADLDEDEQLEWLDREAEAQAENEIHEAEIASEGQAA